MRIGRAQAPLVLLVIALALAAASGEAWQRMGTEYVRYEGVGPGMDSMLVVAGGWPLPYLLDSPVLSPVNSVSFAGGLLGIDHFRGWRFVADVVVFWLIVLALWRVSRRGRRPARAQ